MKTKFIFFFMYEIFSLETAVIILLYNERNEEALPSSGGLEYFLSSKTWKSNVNRSMGMVYFLA